MIRNVLPCQQMYFEFQAILEPTVLLALYFFIIR